MVQTLLKGLPTSSGRHGGCRLLITRNGALLVGTGDAAVGTNPQNLGSLGGKTLRLNRTTGKPWPTNPFINGNGKRRFVLTYGHRNVQGLAQRRDGTLWSVEHGSFRDDEVNKLVGGRQLRLEPGARLQRVGADDRLRAARQAARRALAFRRPDARDLGRDVRPRRPVAAGCRGLSRWRA